MLRGYGTLACSLLLFLLLSAAWLMGWMGEPMDAPMLTLFGWSPAMLPAVQLGVGVLLTLLDAALLVRLVGENALFDTRSSLGNLRPTSPHPQSPVFFLLMACAPFALPLTAGSVSLPLTILAILILVTTHQQQRSVSEYFSAFLLLGLASLFVPQWLLIVPFVLMGCMLLGSLTLRTFLAALLGLITPWWTAAGVLYLMDGMERFVTPFREFVLLPSIGHLAALPLGQLCGLVVVTLLALPALIHYPAVGPTLKERSRVVWLFLILLLAGTLLLTYTQPQLVPLLYPLLAALISLFVAQLVFTLHNRRSRTVCQLMILVVLLLYATRPLWMPSSNS